MTGSVVLIICVVVVTGIVAYVTHRHIRSQIKEQSEKVSVPIVMDEHTVDDANFSQVKKDAAESIRICHEKAVQAINESLQTIYSGENTEEVITENSEALDFIDNDLDNLLK